MTRRGGRRAALLLAVLAVSFAQPATAAWIEYILLEANAGGSSGGHAAIRFGDRAYHFQNERGQLRLRREPIHQLLYEYVLVGNRGVRVSRIEVSDETWLRLRERFETRRFAQRRQSSLLQSLTRERRLLEQLAASSDTIDLALPAAGYLEPSAPGDASPTLARLRSRIEKTLGRGFLAQQRRSIEARVHALDPGSTPDPPPLASADLPPPPFTTFADRTIELASTLAALASIEDGSRLRPGSYGTLDAEDPLTVEERAALERAAARLDARLLVLVSGTTPVPGHALLVALARRAALERSLLTGRLVFLDAYPVDARSIDSGSGLLAGPQPDLLLADAAADLARAREELVEADASGERILARLEETANRYAEIALARHGGGTIRLQRDRMVPMRPAHHSVPAPEAKRAEIESALFSARRREERWRSSLDHLHGYALVSHNCVSAIFETLHAEFDDPKTESIERLGGYVDPRGPLRFWPLVSAAAVRSRYRISEEWTLASHRRDRVAEMRSSENDLWVALRESNTLTARTYAHSPEDSLFLFFTDGPETIAIRPLLGAINLGVSLVEVTRGVLRAPFDQGRGFISGVSGIMMSAPELGFVNLRKGSNLYVARKYRVRIDAALSN